ncbi:multidrug efflux MFS transporter NorA [Kurthia sibirica]|uniref:Multidrug efflux MFS transporter NorA n=1 Tax=Kurthia sibirica TaxID=202750 RepID=A0A2U3ALN1_9BACL|nr:multidrug efflux MFS transporter NorA [Kurthia sibirica]PWI25438.1 multidrug efflux MFS transporter NorA [Kurthia sibirica]GEK34326.1 multidrug efflux MFS transporter NorA [Kurthia sibirica]
MKNNRTTLFILLGNLFIAFLGIGLIIPILPTIMNEFGVSGTVVGYLTAAFALSQLIVSPFAGKAADKFGRKIMIVLGLIIFAFSELLFGLASSIEMLFVSRILGGVAGAFIMPAVTAFIADITTTDSRPKALGFMSAAINIGFIIGPGIGGFLAEFGTRVPFFAAAALGSVAALLSIILLKEPKRQQSVADAEITPKKKSFMGKLMAPIFLLPFILIFMSSFGLAALESFFSLFVDHKFNFTPKDVAIAITGGAIIGAIFQLLLFDRMVRKIGEINIIRYSLIYSVVFVIAIVLAPSYWTVMLVCFVVFIGFDLIRPALTTYLSKIAGDEQGFVGGMNSMFTSLANILGPILGGMLFDVNISLPYYFAAILLFIGFILSLFWKKQKTTKIHAS